MTDFFDELESQLKHAAHARSRRRLRVPRWIRGVPALAAAAVAVAVLVLALTLLHHGHSATGAANGGVLREPQPAVIKYFVEAFRQERPCLRGARQSQGPATSDGAPGASLLSLLAVLRRPATAADRLPRSLVGEADARGVYVRYIRLARVSDGISYYILPAESINQADPELARCDPLVLAAVRAELPRIPQRFRAATLAFAEKWVTLRRRLTDEASGAGVCLVTIDNHGNSGTCGATAAQLATVGLLSFSAQVSGIVPDGVATVTLRYPDGGGRHAKTVTARVVGNVFASTAALAFRLPRPSMVWRAANGTVLKTVPAGARTGGGSGFCSGPPRRHGRPSFC